MQTRAHKCCVVAGPQPEWEASVLGHDKRTLLKEVVLPLIVTNNALSRLALDFNKRLAAAQANAGATPG